MKFSKILFFSLLFLLPISLSACTIQTVGLSKDNFLGHEQEVKDIQVLLAQDFDLYYPGWVTGYFGELTASGIKNLQARYGIAQTGVMDQNTINILCHQQSKNLCPIRNYGYTVGDEDKVNKNNDIRIVQQLLSKTKKYHTGYYGKVTAQLIAAFQSKYKLNVTGVFTEETRVMMCKMLTGNTSVVSTVDLELASVSSSQGNKIKMDEKTSIVLKEKNNYSIELPVHSLLVKLNGKSATGVLDKLGVGQEREQELLSFVCDSPGDKIFEVFLDYTDNIKEIDEVNNIKQLVVSCDGGDDYGYECLIDKNYQCAYGKGGRIDDVEKCSESCVKSTELSKPDLLISKVERDGDKIKIYEENKGVVADKHFLEVKLSYNDQTIDFGKPVELPYMIKGERDFSFDFKCPADGVFNFKFNIDSTNVINESNELNNVFEKEIICGDVVDVSNIMYSCNKENGRCYISTENTVGDYLNIEDCINNCAVDSDLTESKQGEGYCCDVENGQCTYYEDAKDRSQKGEPCCSEEGRCSELCAGLYEQKQQTTPEDKTEQKAYCCSVKEKRCIAYSPAEAVKLNKGGVFCSYDMQECSGACAKIIKAEEEKDLAGKPIMYFVENTNTKLETTCAYNQIKIGWSGLNKVVEYSENIALNKTGKAIDYTQLVFVYGNSSLVAGNMDFVPIQDSGSIAFDKLVSGDITPLICSQDISSINDVFQWQADNNKGTVRYDCFPLSSSVLSLECTDENEVAGYSILESSSVACNQDGNIHLDLKVKSLIEKDIDVRVVVAAPYEVDEETYLQVLFQEYYTLGAGKVKSISEDFPNLKRVGNGKDVIIFVFSGSNAFADGATLSSVLMTNMDYYKYIEKNLGPVCGVKDPENIEGTIMFAEPTRQVVDVYGNWINSKGKISASFSNISGVLPTLTVDLSKIFNNSITVSKIGNISPLSIDNNPNSSRYSSDTDVVFLKLKVTNGAYKGELKMSFSANISADIGGSKINIPYPEQKILTMSFSAEAGLIPGEYLLPLELKGFMPDEYEAKYVFNWYLDYLGNKSVSYLEINTHLLDDSKIGKDVSIAPTPSSEYLTSYVRNYEYGDKIDLDKIYVRAKECKDTINVTVNSNDFGIYGDKYVFNKYFDSSFGDKEYKSAKSFSISKMCDTLFTGNHEILFTNDCLDKPIKWVISCAKPANTPTITLSGSEDQEVKCGGSKDLSFSIITENIKDKKGYEVYYYYGYVSKRSSSITASISDLYQNLLRQYFPKTSSSQGSQMKNLFGITKGVDINNIAIEKEFSDSVLGVMDGAMGGMFVFREKKGDLLDYTKNAKCLTSMCASSETGTRDNPKQILSYKYWNWKEGFVGVVVVKDGVVVSDPLYIALQCNSDEVIDMSKVDFTGFSKGSSIDIFVNGLGGRNLQIKRYIVYPVYMSGYGSISENSVQSEFNINGNFTDSTALSYCNQKGAKPAYIKYLIIGAKRWLYVFDPCNVYSTVSNGSIEYNSLKGDQIILEKNGYFNPLCARYVNIGNKSFDLNQNSFSVPISSISNKVLNFSYDNWISNGSTLVSGLKQEINREGINNNLYDIYANQLRVVESLCESLPKQVEVNAKTENTFEYVGYEKVSNSLVLVKIKADVKNKDVGITLKIGEGSKRYTFSSTGTYELRVYYDIFDGSITSVETAKISFVQNLLHKILGIDTALAVYNPYPLPSYGIPEKYITCYECESTGKCSSYTKQISTGNDYATSSIFNLLAWAPPGNSNVGSDNDDKDDPCYPDYSSKTDCESNCKATVPGLPIPSTSPTTKPSKATCWLYASKSGVCYQPTYQWECMVVLSKYSSKAECEKDNDVNGGGDDKEAFCWLYSTVNESCYEAYGYACYYYKSYETKDKCELSNGVGSPIIRDPVSSTPVDPTTSVSSIPPVSPPSSIGMSFCYIYNESLDTCLISKKCTEGSYPTYASCMAKDVGGGITTEKKCYYKIGNSCVSRTTTKSCYVGEYDSYAECMNAKSIIDHVDYRNDDVVFSDIGYCWHVEGGKCVGVKADTCFVGEYKTKAECEKELSDPSGVKPIDDVISPTITLPEKQVDLNISVVDDLGDQKLNKTITVGYTGDYTIKSGKSDTPNVLDNLIEYYKKLFNIK